MEGLIARKELGEWADHARRAGEIVFTNGCFDVIHPGHLDLLEWSASQGDVVLVAINDDESVTRLKGAGRPVYPARERAEILLALRWVHAVTVFSEDTPLETILATRPDVLIKGAEYGSGQIVGEPEVLEWGGRVERFPMKAGYSTTDIITRIRGGRD